MAIDLKKIFVSNMNKPDCEVCKLNTLCMSPKMRYRGEGRLGILIIGQSPSIEEDSRGLFGYGRYYKFLEKTLEDMGYDLERDFWYTTSIGCKTPRNRVPTLTENRACYPRLERTIQQLNPNVLILLGKAPFDSVIQPTITGRLTKVPFNKFYGDTIPSQIDKRWVCPTWDAKDMLATKTYEDSNYTSKPLYQRDKAHYNLWKQHLQQAINLYNKDIHVINYVSKCQTTQDIDIAIDWITEAHEWEYIAFDYETTGLKPHREGHRIVCSSISNGRVSYSFPLFEDASFKKIWKRLLTSNKKLIAHNASYEWQWTKQLLGYWPTTLHWDTMLSAHCLNNNKTTGLKYTTYALTGVIGYDDKADPYLKASTKDVELYGDNAFNHIHEVDMDDLLLYNAMDSLFTAIIYEEHKSIISPFQLEGANFLFESSVTLAKTSHNGFRIDMERFNDVTAELEEKILDAQKAIMQSDEVALWDGQNTFNFDSSPQLSHLLYDILGLKAVKTTPAGVPSVDAEALENLKSPLVEKILYQRKLKKLLGTYIAQYKVESVDGYIHSQFYLNSVKTFRSSAGSVNIQNIPQRDLDAKKAITSLIVPREGRKLIGYDYKAIEVGVNACHSQDKNLISYVNDSSKDMHGDSAMDLFLLDKEELTKPVRQGTKGGYVFSTLYGSYWKQTAPDMWELAIKEGLIEHLAKKGIKDYSSFEMRVKKAEEIFWGVRFHTHDRWRKYMWNHYQEKGYTQSFTGFRMYAPQSRNNSFNSAPQGDAYHVLQWTMNNVVREIEERGMKALPIFEIHDSVYFDAPPEEEEMLDKLMYEYGILRVKEYWKWIVVNFQIEKSTGPVGANWSELNDAGYIKGGL